MTEPAQASETPEKHKHTNALINETSPYLLQHAHNPVNWYPWGSEAIQKAREKNKPIFLSIGYSACHWCHVMEHESFENEEIAKTLNKHFVSIKVDREERPDLDDIYMSAVQMMTGQGGWPMTVFLTPGLKPFYGGTYFPPTDKFGRPGFDTLTTSIAEAWRNDRESILKSADQLTGLMEENAGFKLTQDVDLNNAPLEEAIKHLKRDYDLQNGGWGGAPKFPSAHTIEICFRHYHHTGNDAALGMAFETLRAMANGGMYDHLGGGFHRYAVDQEWLVPHFEKMLYDNGQLAPVYLNAYQITGDDFFKQIAKEIFEYQLRDMTGDHGAFFSTEDADSEGEEGKFYIWTYDEIMQHLGEEHGKLFARYYSVQPNGNFNSHEEYHKGQNILHIDEEPSKIAEDLGITVDELETRMEPMRKTLLEARDKRVHPGLDDKIITAWNGYMIAAMAQGYQVLGDDQYRRAAEKAAHFILTEMRADNGMLYRAYRNGEAKHVGYLDDHANIAIALTDLYEATFDLQWLDKADDIAKTMVREFHDDDGKGFFYTSDEHKNLVTRQKPTYDGSEPSGNSMAAMALLRLSKLTDNSGYYDMAHNTIKANCDMLEKHPQAFMKMLAALDFALSAPKEIAIAGAHENDTVKNYLNVIHSHYVPNKVIALVNPDDAPENIGDRVPLLARKGKVDGRAAVYVCENFACKAPVTSEDGLRDALALKSP